METILAGTGGLARTLASEEMALLVFGQAWMLILAPGRACVHVLHPQSRGKEHVFGQGATGR